DITVEKGGFTVKFGGGLCVLVGQEVPTQFFNVCSFFPKTQKKKVEEDMQEKSDVKEVIRESLVMQLSRYELERAKGKGKATAGKARSAIKEGKSCRIMYHFADDLPFYTVPGLEARALRLLGHKDFKDLKNGKHFTGDDFSDEESTEEVFAVLFTQAVYDYNSDNNITAIAELDEVFCQSAIESAQNDHAMVVQSMIDNKTAHLTKIKALFSEIGAEESGVLTIGVFEEKIKTPAVRQYFEALGLDVWDAWPGRR
ncbi:NaCP60E, partial [Symbiodinium necroappetens]